MEKYKGAVALTTFSLSTTLLLCGVTGCKSETREDKSTTETIFEDEYYNNVFESVCNVVGESTRVEAPPELGWANVTSESNALDETNFWIVSDVTEDTIIVFAYLEDLKFAVAEENQEFHDKNTGVSASLENGKAIFKTNNLDYDCTSIWGCKYSAEESEVFCIWHE